MPHTLCSTASTTSIPSHWHSLLVLLNILEELHSALQLPAIDGLCGFSRVLEGDSKVGSTGTSGLRWVYLCSGVSNLNQAIPSASAVGLVML
jgi:hypothetical protein